LTLDQIARGSVARILDVTGNDTLAIRLMEMGLIEGEPIELIGAAPLGDPLEYSVRGYRLSLRANEAKRVVVEPFAGCAP
jgi:ferrous iron transport protein A